MGTTSAEIQAEIEETRRRMAARLDEMLPSGQGTLVGAVVSGVTEQARRRPLAALGLALLGGALVRVFRTASRGATAEGGARPVPPPPPGPDRAAPAPPAAPLAERDLAVDITPVEGTAAPDAPPVAAVDVVPPPGQGERATVDLLGEDLGVRTVPTTTGEVRVSKEVVEEERTLDVPVVRESVSIESVPVEDPSAVPDDAFQRGAVSVPVSREEVELSKEVRLAEELDVQRLATSDAERVISNVRGGADRGEGEPPPTG